MTKIKVAFYSMSGNTRSFVEKLDVESIDIMEKPSVNESFILLTPTYFFGQVPDEVGSWLMDNGSNMRGVISFGNRNWGSNFAKAGDIISESYGVPLLDKVEMRGTDDDVRRINEGIASGKAWRE